MDTNQSLSSRGLDIELHMQDFDDRDAAEFFFTIHQAPGKIQNLHTLTCVIGPLNDYVPQWFVSVDGEHDSSKPFDSAKEAMAELLRADSEVEGYINFAG